jgi:hypothetical protein
MDRALGKRIGLCYNHSLEGGFTMVEVSVPVPEALAKELEQVRDRLPEILELGLRQLAVQEQPVSVQDLRQILAQQGLLAELEPLSPEDADVAVASERLSPLQIEGRPVSELIVEERNRW